MPSPPSSCPFPLHTALSPFLRNHLLHRSPCSPCSVLQTEFTPVPLLWLLPHSIHTSGLFWLPTEQTLNQGLRSSSLLGRCSQEAHELSLRGHGVPSHQTPAESLESPPERDQRSEGLWCHPLAGWMLAMHPPPPPPPNPAVSPPPHPTPSQHQPCATHSRHSESHLA